MEMMRRRESPRSSRSGEEQAIQRSLDQAERGMTDPASCLSESGVVSSLGGVEGAHREIGGQDPQAERVRTPRSGGPLMVNPFWSPAAVAEAALQHARPAHLAEAEEQLQTPMLDGVSRPSGLGEVRVDDQEMEPTYSPLSRPGSSVVRAAGPSADGRRSASFCQERSESVVALVQAEGARLESFPVSDQPSVPGRWRQRVLGLQSR